VLASAAATAAAGTVTVVFVHPENYTDARDWPDRDSSANQQTISKYFKWLGQKYLPPEQTLQIEVLDVDLAGKLRTSARWGMVRIIGNPLDWPQMSLRYRLESGGKVLDSAEELISDKAYDQHLGGEVNWDTLSYEKHMMKDWFRKRFAKK
jgi:hypothetical protein